MKLVLRPRTANGVRLFPEPLTGATAALPAYLEHACRVFVRRTLHPALPQAPGATGKSIKRQSFEQVRKDDLAVHCSLHDEGWIFITHVQTERHTKRFDNKLLLSF